MTTMTPVRPATRAEAEALLAAELRAFIDTIYRMDAVERGMRFFNPNHKGPGPGGGQFTTGGAGGAGSGKSASSKGKAAGSGVAKKTGAGSKTGTAKASGAKTSSSKAKATKSAIPKSYEDLQKMTAIAGPHGSQDGEWREDGAGHQFYIKPAISAEHAYNEVGAMKVYELQGLKSGVEIPHTAVVQDANGNHYIVSQKIAGVHQENAAWWSGATPEATAARAAAAKQFGTDVLLAHWDTAGETHDNLLVGVHGEPVRIETGGAMAFRAQGGVKSSWKEGGSFGEAWTMRGQAHDGVPGNKQDGAVFGHMTDAEAAKSLGSAAKSLDAHIANGDVEKAWTAIGMPKAQRDENLKVLSDRIARTKDVQDELTGKAAAKASGPSKPAKSADEPLGAHLKSEDIYAGQGKAKTLVGSKETYEHGIVYKSNSSNVQAKLTADQEYGGYRLQFAKDGNFGHPNEHDIHGLSLASLNAYMSGASGKGGFLAKDEITGVKKVNAAKVKALNKAWAAYHQAQTLAAISPPPTAASAPVMVGHAYTSKSIGDVEAGDRFGQYDIRVGYGERYSVEAEHSGEVTITHDDGQGHVTTTTHASPFEALAHLGSEGVKGEDVKLAVHLAAQDAKYFKGPTTKAQDARIAKVAARRDELNQKFGTYDEAKARALVSDIYTKYPGLSNAVESHLHGGAGSHLQESSVIKQFKYSMKSSQQLQVKAKAREALNDLHEVSEWSLLNNGRASREGTVSLFRGTSEGAQKTAQRLETAARRGTPFSSSLTIAHSFSGGGRLITAHVPASAVSIWHGIRPGNMYQNEREYTVGHGRITHYQVRAGTGVNNILVAGKDVGGTGAASAQAGGTSGAMVASVGAP